LKFPVGSFTITLKAKIGFSFLFSFKSYAFWAFPDEDPSQNFNFIKAAVLLARWGSKKKYPFCGNSWSKKL
jgi:hypothetical protein